jgi:hypothetical protein
VTASAGSGADDPSSDLSEASGSYVAPLGAVPDGLGDLSGRFGDVAPVNEQGNDAKSPRLVLTDGQWRTEATLLAWLAVEHVRVVEPADSRVTTGYVNGVADNARALAVGMRVCMCLFFAVS